MGCGVLLAVLAACSRAGSDPAEPRITPRNGPAETRRGVTYAATAPQQTLDLYLPAGDGTTVFPLIVLVHGGGFEAGSSSDLAAMAEAMVSSGFAAASVNYRLSGDAQFPAGVQDVAAAVRYVRAQAPGWGVDPRRIGIAGDSAGGYLASMIGATGGTRTFNDPALGNSGVSGAVQAVVSWYGPSDFDTMDAQARENGCDDGSQQHHAAGSPESRWLGAELETVPDTVRRASVLQYVADADSLPPYYLVHGTRDCTVAPGQSQQLQDALRTKGAQVTLVMVDGAGHSDPRIITEQLGPTLKFLHAALHR
jgi:acetyl esterase/lipase